MVYPPVREIIHELKLVDYLLVQADKPWYNLHVNGLANVVIPINSIHILSSYVLLHTSVQLRKMLGGV